MSVIGFLVMVMLATTTGYSAVDVGLTKVCAEPDFCLIVKATNDHHTYTKRVGDMSQDKKYFSYADEYKNFDEARLRDYEPIIIGNNENCKTKIRYLAPYYIQVKGNNHEVISPDQQKIRWTECYNTAQPCFGTVLSSDEPAKCEEKKGNIKLYVYNSEKNETLEKNFPVPVACVCQFKSPYLF